MQDVDVLVQDFNFMLGKISVAGCIYLLQNTNKKYMNSSGHKLTDSQKDYLNFSDVYHTVIQTATYEVIL